MSDRDENRRVKEKESECRLHKHGMLDSDFNRMMAKLREEEPLDEDDLLGMR